MNKAMMQCIYCEQDTAGNHDINCPNNPANWSTSGGTVEYSGLPPVTDTPPMPKCKPPMDEGTTAVDDKLLEVLTKKAQAYDNIMASSEWKESAPLPRKELPTCNKMFSGGFADLCRPRKEVISIRPGDVITIKQDNPIEWLSFCVTDGHSNRVTFPRGKFTLEVYREQDKASKASNCPGVCSKCDMRCLDRQEPKEPQIEMVKEAGF